uniref:Uncharacterized protein n=1 Tax=Panagrolaimus sp. JU765 TaxID=591449 RepID=A0AC34RJ55_9BILA
TVENDEIFDSEDGNLEIIETDKYSRNGMETFLKWPEYQHWKGFIRFNDNGTLEKFFAVVAYHGNDMISWNHRANLLNEFRAIADK